MLMLAYSCGLRVSEAVSIKTIDIDSKRMCILIKQAKGKMDRYVMLSELFLEVAREYFIKYKPKEFLFEGVSGGMYSPRSVQEIIKRAVQKAKIRKRDALRLSLRHQAALDVGLKIDHKGHWLRLLLFPHYRMWRFLSRSSRITLFVSPSPRQPSIRPAPRKRLPSSAVR